MGMDSVLAPRAIQALDDTGEWFKSLPGAVASTNVMPGKQNPGYGGGGALDGVLAPRAQEMLTNIGQWLKALPGSMAPKPASVQPPAKQAAPSGEVADSRLQRFVTDIMERIGPLETGLPGKAAPAAAAPGPWVMTPDRARSMPNPITDAMEWAFPHKPQTFDQEFPIATGGGPAAGGRAAGRPVARAAGGRAAPAGALASMPINGLDLPPEGQSQGALVAAAEQPAAAEAPRRGLMDLYKEMMGNVPKEAKGDLTQGQKDKLAMEFFMSMLSGSSKPGAYMLGAMGDAGTGTLKTSDAYEKENLARSGQDIARARDDVFKQISLQDKDEDNQRADKRTAAEQRRWEAGDKRDQDRLKLQREIFESGKWETVKGKTGTIQLINKTTGETKDTGIKYEAAASAGSAEERIIDRMMRDPAFKQTMMEYKGKTGDVTDTGAFKAALDLVKADTTGKRTLDSALDEVRRTLGNKGGAPQSLPAGLPQGSKQIGTSNGKRVFQTPDGKRLIEK